MPNAVSCRSNAMDVDIASNSGRGLTRANASRNTSARRYIPLNNATSVSLKSRSTSVSVSTESISRGVSQESTTLAPEIGVSRSFAVRSCARPVSKNREHGIGICSMRGNVDTINFIESNCRGVGLRLKMMDSFDSSFDNCNCVSSSVHRTLSTSSSALQRRLDISCSTHVMRRGMMVEETAFECYIHLGTQSIII